MNDEIFQKEKMGGFVTVLQASKETGISQRDLRSFMKHKVIDIGIADRKDGCEKYRYIIFRDKLDRFKAEMGEGCISYH